jgi:hypothetical protein
MSLQSLFFGVSIVMLFRLCKLCISSVTVICLKIGSVAVTTGQGKLTNTIYFTLPPVDALQLIFNVTHLC